MNMTTALITLALIAWILQIVFSWFQIQHFNKAFTAMKRGKYIGVGRNKAKRFQPRVLIALSFDEHNRVIDSVLMKGLTVFALPKPITSLHGVYIENIDPKKVFPDQPSCQSALETALKKSW